MIYDEENNIALIEISSGKIDHTIELGNFLIHVSKTKKPILIEILEASKFIGEFSKNDKKTLNSIKKIIPADLF